MVRQYSQPWEEEKSKLLQKLRGDYEGMRRQLSIALTKIEMMAAEVGHFTVPHRSCTSRIYASSRPLPV